MTPESVGDPGCAAEPSELRALCDYYLFKRLRFQKSYFDRQSKKADVNSWSARWKVSLWLFYGSVGIVLAHGLVALLLATTLASHGDAEPAKPQRDRVARDFSEDL